MPSPSGCGSTPPWQPSDVPASPTETSPRTSSDTLSQCACKLRESADQPSLCCLVTNPRLRRAPTSTPTSSSGNGHSTAPPRPAPAGAGTQPKPNYAARPPPRPAETAPPSPDFGITATSG